MSFYFHVQILSRPENRWPVLVVGFWQMVFKVTGFLHSTVVSSESTYRVFVTLPQAPHILSDSSPESLPLPYLKKPLKRSMQFVDVQDVIKAVSKS